MKSLALISLSGSTVRENRIQKLANWMGIDTQSFVVDVDSDICCQLLGMMATNRSLSMSAETLAALYEGSRQPAGIHRCLRENCSSLLVFGCDDPPRLSRVLSWLSEGAVEGIASNERTQSCSKAFCFPKSSQEFSRQLSGLEFSSNRPTSLVAFQLNTNKSTSEAILLAEGRPVFICLKIGTLRIFLISGQEVPDIDEPMSRQSGIEEKYDLIVPFLIFLRSCFPDECWHGLHNTARIIIDDPLLRDRYGLLDYKELLKSMRQDKYGTSIAFIPWNYRRTAESWAEGLLKEEANLSVCIHGCDHSNREFEDLDAGVLMHKARLALERMERHEERTRIPFERVMVFPQGRFSRAAIAALRANRYLAAVNTSCFPVDYTPGQLTMGDFLRPAIVRFDGFPIFHRHYPRRTIDSAFDVFLGKPALLVEHHQYFGDGCKALAEFVRQLHKSEPRLSWPTLSSQLSQSCMVRYRTSDVMNVRFFTNRFQMKNTNGSKRSFLLEKSEPDPSVVQTVLLDGKPVPFQVKSDLIQFEVEAEPGQTTEIVIEDYRQPISKYKDAGVSYAVGVFIRRRLSEFRDNTLSKNPRALGTAKRLARGLKVTGDKNGKIKVRDQQNRNRKAEK